MIANIYANTNEWKLYTPSDTLVIDKLNIPPGMDIDKLAISVD